jgi:hypothetical protein
MAYAYGPHMLAHLFSIPRWRDYNPEPVLSLVGLVGPRGLSRYPSKHRDAQTQLHNGHQDICTCFQCGGLGPLVAHSLVAEAQANRSPTAKIIDGLTTMLAPTRQRLLSWTLSCARCRGSYVTGRYWTLDGLIIIVIACPCVLTISTPVAYVAGLAAFAQCGIVGRDWTALGSVKTVILDKTGTVMEGKFNVNERARKCLGCWP